MTDSSILVCLWVYLFLFSVVVLWGLLTLFHVTCIVQFVVFRPQISSHFSLWTQDFLGVAATISGRAHLGIFKGQILHCVFSGKFKKDWMKCRWRLQAPENSIETPIWCRTTTKLFWFGLVEVGTLAETVSLGCNSSTVGAGGGRRWARTWLPHPRLAFGFCDVPYPNPAAAADPCQYGGPW